MNNDCHETGRKLGVGRSTVFHLWKTNELKSVRIGRRRFSTDNQIAEFLSRLEAIAQRTDEPRGVSQCVVPGSRLGLDLDKPTDFAVAQPRPGVTTPPMKNGPPDARRARSGGSTTPTKDPG